MSSSPAAWLPHSIYTAAMLPRIDFPCPLILACGMAFSLEDAIGGRIVTVVAVGAAALLLPRLFPSFAAPLRAITKTGLTLFLEAETEMEGGLIDGLVGQTVDVLLGTLDGPGTAEQRKQAARRTMRSFEAAARGRSKRWGRDHDDRVRRYHRHLAHLRRALTKAELTRPAAERELIGDAVSVIAEDW